MCAELLLKGEVYAIIGAAIEVHKELRTGFAEAVHQESMQFELGDRQIPFVAQGPLVVRYKHHQLECKFKPDLLCFGSIIVELKAVEALTTEHEAQVLNYLRVTGLRVGLLIHFGRSGTLEWKRLVL